MDDEFEEDLPTTMSASWLPEQAISALITERTLNPQETEEMTARRLLRENLPTAILGIVHTATHGENSRIRLDAQKYITERVLGRVGDDAYGSSESPLTEFAKAMSDAFEKIEAHANSGKPS